MYERFKQWARDHDVSVGTMVGLLGFIGFTASGIVSQVGNYDYSGLPTWAQSVIGMGLAALVIIGRFATSFATWLGKVPPIPQAGDIEASIASGAVDAPAVGDPPIGP